MDHGYDYVGDVYDRRHTTEERHGDDLLAAAVKGAVTGLAATAVLSLGLQYGSRLLPPRAGEGEQPTEKLADEIAETVADVELDDSTKKVAEQAIRWGYGIGWGAAFGMAQSQLRLPALLAGLTLGALIGSIASTVVPAMHLIPPPSEQPLAMNAFMRGIHLVYGETTALVYEALS